VTEEALRGAIQKWIIERSPLHQPVDETVDLIASGALDSMGFVELLSYVESCIDRKLDLLELDAEAFTSIEGLVRCVLTPKTPV
jgi:acyl carrier protein